jgi:hypothetical protein
MTARWVHLNLLNLVCAESNSIGQIIKLQLLHCLLESTRNLHHHLVQPFQFGPDLASSHP